MRDSCRLDGPHASPISFFPTHPSFYVLLRALEFALAGPFPTKFGPLTHRLSENLGNPCKYSCIYCARDMGMS